MSPSFPVTTPLEDRHQTPAEERANALSHGLGLLGALIAAPLMIVAAVKTGDATKIVAASVFSGSMILMYLSSTIYHLLPRGRAKSVFQVIDHAVIFLFIAGSYTPFTLGVLRGAWGWSISGVVWAIAIAGILLKLFCGVRHPRLSMALYLAMGWVSIVAVYPLCQRLSVPGFAWLLAGGLAYTGGVIYFLNDYRVHFHHFRWHLFVLAGTACHVVSVYRYAI